jgi:hypothetical protein
MIQYENNTEQRNEILEFLNTDAFNSLDGAKAIADSDFLPFLARF